MERRYSLRAVTFIAVMAFASGVLVMDIFTERRAAQQADTLRKAVVECQMQGGRVRVKEDGAARCDYFAPAWSLSHPLRAAR